MQYRARLVLPISSPPIENGCIAVEDGRILSVGCYEGGAAEDLGDVILMPGLVNAHCHLDYTSMRGAILSNRSFTAWVRRINDLKRTLTDDDYLAAIAAGFSELAASGCTTVLNIEAFPELMVRLDQPPIRTWWFYEMLDLRMRVHTDDVVAGALSFFDDRRQWLGGFGLSPHAPYTASARLFELARACCGMQHMPLTTHLAESDEEFEMFVTARGDLHDFLAGIGRSMDDCGKGTPVAHLAPLLPDGAILAHMNFVEESDWPLLRGRGFSVVHCPMCHRYFGRPPFPVERFLAEGMNVCLGTDSLASNHALDMFSEMQELLRSHPALNDETVLRMATLNGAAAVGRGRSLGELSPGACADFITIPATPAVHDAVAAAVWNTAGAERVFVAGREVPLNRLRSSPASGS